RPDDAYHVNDLLGYHDEHFVRNAFLALLKRPAGVTELADYVQALRAGRLGKLDLLRELSASDEARARRVALAGLPPGAWRRMTQLPIIGRLLRTLRAFTRLPVLLTHVQQLESYTLGQQQRIADHLNLFAEKATHDHEELRATLRRHAAELDAARHQHDALRQQTNQEIEGVRREVAAVRQQLDGVAAQFDAASAQLDAVAAQLDAVAAHFSVNVEMISRASAQLAADLSEVGAGVRDMSVDLSVVAKDMAHLHGAVGETRAEMADNAETLVLIADALAGVVAHSPELSVPKSLVTKQRQLEELAHTLAGQSDANRELIRREQFAIVEAQKAALAEIQRQVEELRMKAEG
ncbi:MAG: hypothetical protein ACRD9R_13355, partial [Pyrinomonadaceae bacterium]